MTGSAPLALIVDDDPLQQRILQASLAKLGVESEAFATSREFIARLKTASPALCFIDLNLEKQGLGYTIIEAVRHVRGWEPVLIVFSGETSAEAIAHAMEVGADDYLTKPLVLKTLAEKISQYVKTSELEDREADLKPVSLSAEARLEVGFNLTYLDEVGVHLRGPHLLPKGVVVRLSGAPLQEATGRGHGVLVTIVSNKADGSGSYEAFGEFDTADEELLNSVRLWLAARG